MVGKFGGEAAMRLVGLGHDQKPARVLVETVDDAGPRDAADAGEARAAMGDERIDEGLVGVAGARMDDEAGRLVDDDERVVLIDDVERDRLALRAARALAAAR